MSLFNKKMQKNVGFEPIELDVESIKGQNNEIEKHVGKKIKLFRQLRGLSQSDVAVHLGITFQQFQKYESGKNRIPISRLMKLAEIFGVNMTVFFENSVNVTFESIMNSKATSLKEDVKPIEVSSVNEGAVKSFSVEQMDDELKALIRNFKAIKDVSVKNHISMLVKSLSQDSKHS